MRKNAFNRLRLFPFTVLAAVLLLIPFAVSASENCGERDESVHKTCKYVQYKTLPTELKKLMTKIGCDVKSGSNYDYGYAVDLDSNGKPEYAFCCNESKHGPCGMKIFGKSAKKWEVLYDYMPGFDDGNTPCFGFSVLKKKSSGYNDVCINDGAETVRFKKGKYSDK
jgi:hypothetical protein